MLISERSQTFSSKAYRYGFNGMEGDDEVKGQGNSLDFGARIYDSRLGRWLAQDPLGFAFIKSPYNSMSNNPINNIDPTGMGDYYAVDGTKLGSDDKNDDKAYITTQDAINNATKDKTVDWSGVQLDESTQLLSVSNSTLGKMAQTVSNESSGNKEESYGIASAIVNRANRYNSGSVDKTLTKGIYGYDGTQDFSNDKFGLEAALNAITGGYDYSNGADAWDGRDIWTYKNHYRFRSGGISVDDELTPQLKQVQNNVMNYYAKTAFKDDKVDLKSASFKNWLKTASAVNFTSYYTSHSIEIKSYCIGMVIHNEPNCYKMIRIGSKATWDMTAGHGQTLFYKEIRDIDKRKEVTNTFNPKT